MKGNPSTNNNNILSCLSTIYIQNSTRKEIKLPIPDSQIDFYALYFCSSFHPFYTDITKLLINYYTKQNETKKIIEIIYISCDEMESDFKSTIEVLNIPWLILPFESKDIKNNLLDKYLIHSIPMLIILDKNGQKITSLKNSEILQLNNDIDIQSWKNLANDKNNVSNAFALGSTGYSPCHMHPLVYSDWTTKSPGYSGGWNCDECRKSFNKAVPNYYCMKCGYDICDECFRKNK